MNCNWQSGFGSLRASGLLHGDALHRNRRCGIAGGSHQLALTGPLSLLLHPTGNEGLDPPKLTAEEVG